MKRQFFVLPLFAAICTTSAQEVHPDRTVTFHFTAPNAKEVSVSGDFGKPAPMTQEADGKWSVTVGPLDPNLYSYKVNVDGKSVLDPFNNRFKPERAGSSNVIDVPDRSPSVWDRQLGVAHGIVHLHDYDSKALGTTRRMRVYTPPSYDTDKDSRFPTLYLFHGSGDNEATWTEFGKAHLILDNLIAAGKAKPMIIVMLDGHTMPPVPRDAPGAAEARNKNLGDFERDLLGDAVPFAESHYRLKADRDNRAIIGLSMGGNQSLIIGLNHLDLFAWVGGMSSAVREPDTQLAPFFKEAASANEKLKLLWFGVGKDDFLFQDNQKLHTLLDDKHIKHTYVESAGGHAWPVWRRYLAQFAPLVFQ